MKPLISRSAAYGAFDLAHDRSWAERGRVDMLLKPYRVLDLTGPLGYSTGRILADLGAEVIKIEPPEGDPGRHTPPVLRCDTESPQSLFWLAYNVNKRGITLDLESPTGRNLFLRLLGIADFIIETSPSTLYKHHLDYESLRSRYSSLIWVSISPFGEKGPYSNLQASDLEIMALSGAMSLAGPQDGEPMRVTVPQAPMWVGAEAVMGALTALVYRATSGRGQHVDVSAQVAVISALAHAPTFWDLNRINPERAGIYVTGRSMTGARMRVFWPCRDGWINFILYGGSAGRHANQQLVNWMREKGASEQALEKIDWNSFDVTKITQKEVDALEAPIARFFSTLGKQEFLEGAVQREILGYPVYSPENIYNDAQLAARDFWQECTDPALNTKLTYPGVFAIFNGERPRIGRPSPRLGEHNHEVFVTELGLSTREFEEFEATGVM